jgi:hypothetical protein
MIPSNTKKTLVDVTHKSGLTLDPASSTNNAAKRKADEAFNSKKQNMGDENGLLNNSPKLLINREFSTRNQMNTSFSSIQFDEITQPAKKIRRDDQNNPGLSQLKHPNATLQSYQDIDPFFNENKLVISSFPNDPDAQIKGFNGKLEKIGKGAYWFTGWAIGTTLKETVEIIEKTFSTAHQHFDSIYTQIINDNLLDETQLLRTAFDVEKKLLCGLLNIKNTYYIRYHNDLKKQEDLNELCQLYATAHKQKEEHQNQLEEISKMPFKPEEPVQNIEESSHNLAAYCTRCCDFFFDEQQAIHKILSGQKLLKKIFSADGALPSTNEKEARDEVTNITWLLMYYALKQKQGFDQGSFIIEDSDKLFNFMRGLPLCNERPSSHFEKRPHGTWYEVSGTASDMPARKKVVLFGMVTPFSSTGKILFFKPEDEGATTTYVEMAKHGKDFVVSRAHKLMPGSDDQPGMQKERVPSVTLQTFEELIHYLQKNLELYMPTLNQMLLINLKQPSDDATLWGIAYMHAFVKNFRNTNKLKVSSELAELFTRLEGTWDSLDNLENRTGREVYISKQQLQEFLDSKPDL